LVDIRLSSVPGIFLASVKKPTYEARRGQDGGTFHLSFHPCPAEKYRKILHNAKMLYLKKHYPDDEKCLYVKQLSHMWGIGKAIIN